MAFYRWTGGAAQPQPQTTEKYLYNKDLVYFNTGHKHTADTKIRVKGIFNWCNNYMQIFGARSGSFNTNAFGFFSSFASPRACIYRTGQEAIGSYYNAADSDLTTMFYTRPTIVECEGKTARFYAEEDPTNVHTITANNGTLNGGVAPLALWGCNGSNQADGWNPIDGAIFVFFWAEIYEDGNLVHKYTPAYNNGQYCLWDEVDEVYLYEAQGNSSRLRGSSNIPTT